MRESPARIFLAPSCGEKDCDNERTWCVDPVNGCDGCDAPPIAYIRADIAAAREHQAREQALREAAAIAGDDVITEPDSIGRQYVVRHGDPAIRAAILALIEKEAAP